jgi:hypothetical protein
VFLMLARHIINKAAKFKANQLLLEISVRPDSRGPDQFLGDKDTNNLGAGARSSSSEGRDRI